MKSGILETSSFSNKNKPTCSMPSIMCKQGFKKSPKSSPQPSTPPRGHALPPSHLPHQITCGFKLIQNYSSCGCSKSPWKGALRLGKSAPTLPPFASRSVGTSLGCPSRHPKPLVLCNVRGRLKNLH